MGLPERRRALEKLLAHDGKELRFILGRIGVEKGVCALVDLLLQPIELLPPFVEISFWSSL